MFNSPKTAHNNLTNEINRQQNGIRELICIKRITIENGLTLNLLQTRKFKTNIAAILIRSELTRETAVKNSMLAGILRLGCEKFKTEVAISKECEEMYGAAFETGVVKKGEEHIIQFYIETVRSGGLFEQAGDLLNNIIFNPLIVREGFNADYFELQKERHGEAIAGRINDKRRYALERCVEIMCQNERFGVSGDGYTEELEEVTSESIFEYYKKAVSQSAFEICVIGDLETDRCAEWAKKYFGRLNTQIVAPKPAEIVRKPESVREVTERMNVSQGKLIIGVRCHADWTDAFYRLLILNEITGGGGGSKFFRNIREKHSLCYYINSFIYRAKSIMMIQAGIDGKDYKKVYELAAEELRKTGEGNVADWELEQAKNSVCSHFETLKDSPQGLMDFYMTNALLGVNTEIADIPGIIEGVSKKDICECAQQTAFDTVYFLTGDYTEV